MCVHTVSIYRLFTNNHVHTRIYDVWSGTCEFLSGMAKGKADGVLPSVTDLVINLLD